MENQTSRRDTSKGRTNRRVDYKKNRLIVEYIQSGDFFILILQR